MKRLLACLLALVLAFGMTWSVYANLYGDVTGEGRINSSDALMVLMHATRTKTLTGGSKTAADVSGDGKINSTDALLILNYAVGLLKIFPVEEGGDPDIGHDIFN